MTERGLKNINVIIERLQTFFLFLSRFLRFFNVFFIFSGTFFTSMWESTATLSLLGGARREERGGVYCVATRTACFSGKPENRQNYNVPSNFLEAARKRTV